MTTTGPTNTTGRPVLSTNGALIAEPVHEETPRHIAYRYTLAVTRLALGWVFLWAFLDKTFGLGHETRPVVPGSTEAARPKGSSHTPPWVPSPASLCALVLVVLALTAAVRTLGLGRIWERIPFVVRFGILK